MDALKKAETAPVSTAALSKIHDSLTGAGFFGADKQFRLFPDHPERSA